MQTSWERKKMYTRLQLGNREKQWERYGCIIYSSHTHIYRNRPISECMSKGMIMKDDHDLP